MAVYKRAILMALKVEGMKRTRFAGLCPDCNEVIREAGGGRECSCRGRPFDSVEKLFGEPGQGALEVDEAYQAGVGVAGAAFAPSLASVVRGVSALHCGA